MTRLFTTNPFADKDTPAGGILNQEVEKIAEREWSCRYGHSPNDKELHDAMLLVINTPDLFAEARLNAAKRAENESMPKKLTDAEKNQIQGSVTETLSAVTGLSKERLEGIWEEVKENKKRLDNCTGPHEFTPNDVDGLLGTAKNYKCSKCQGTITSVEHRWYERGLQHGRQIVKTRK
jgi:hypothetical protein